MDNTAICIDYHNFIKSVWEKEVENECIGCY